MSAYKPGDVPTKEVSGEYLRAEYAKVASAFRKTDQQAAETAARVTAAEDRIDGLGTTASALLTATLTLTTSTYNTLASIALGTAGTWLLNCAVRMQNNTSSAWTGTFYARVFDGSAEKVVANRYFAASAYANAHFGFSVIVPGGTHTLQCNPAGPAGTHQAVGSTTPTTYIQAVRVS
jgi:hypothetical protein